MTSAGRLSPSPTGGAVTRNCFLCPQQASMGQAGGLLPGRVGAERAVLLTEPGARPDLHVWSMLGDAAASLGIFGLHLALISRRLLIRVPFGYYRAWMEPDLVCVSETEQERPKGRDPLLHIEFQRGKRCSHSPR